MMDVTDISSSGSRLTRLRRNLTKRVKFPKSEQIQVTLEGILYWGPKKVLYLFRKVPNSDKVEAFVVEHTKEGTRLHPIVKYGVPHLSLYTIRRAMRILPKKLRPSNLLPILWFGCWGLDHKLLRPYVRVGYYVYLGWHCCTAWYGIQEIYLSLNPYQEPQATLRWLGSPLYRAGLNLYPRMLGYSPAATVNLIWFSGLEDLLDITCNGISVYLIEKHRFEGVIGLYGNYSDEQFRDFLARKGKKGYRMLLRLMLDKYALGYDQTAPGVTGATPIQMDFQ
jgi:hypothetical protein